MTTQLQTTSFRLAWHFKGVNDGLERVNDRIDSVQRTMMLGFITLTGGILAGFAAICTLIATTL